MCVCLLLLPYVCVFVGPYVCVFVASVLLCVCLLLLPCVCVCTRGLSAEALSGPSKTSVTLPPPLFV